MQVVRVDYPEVGVQTQPAPGEHHHDVGDNAWLRVVPLGFAEDSHERGEDITAVVHNQHHNADCDAVGNVGVHSESERDHVVKHHFPVVVVAFLEE